MGVVYQPGQELGATDLRIYLRDRNGDPVALSDIRYSVYYWEPTRKEWITLEDLYRQTPAEGSSVGHYYVEWTVPVGQTVGRYQVRWDYRASSTAPYQQVKLDFAIVKMAIGTSRAAEVEDLGGRTFVVY